MSHAPNLLHFLVYKPKLSDVLGYTGDVMDNADL